jgi:hypothetical protein
VGFRITATGAHENTLCTTRARGLPLDLPTLVGLTMKEREFYGRCPREWQPTTTSAHLGRRPTGYERAHGGGPEAARSITSRGLRYARTIATEVQ